MGSVSDPFFGIRFGSGSGSGPGSVWDPDPDPFSGLATCGSGSVSDPILGWPKVDPGSAPGPLFFATVV